MISTRTKAALAAAKTRRVRLGNPRLTSGDTRRARRARTKQADDYASAAYVYIEEARKAGCDSLGKIAKALTARGIETPAGGREWNAAQVRRVIQRVARQRAAADRAAA
jgi:Recombinase